MIRFTEDCDGYTKGTEIEFSAGVEDVYVNWRKVAVYEKTDKLVHPPTRKGGDPRKNPLKVETK